MQKERMEYVCGNRSFRIKVKISSRSRWPKRINCVTFKTKEVVWPSVLGFQGAT